MRSKLSKKLSSNFKERLTNQFSNFKEDKIINIPLGCKVFSCESDEKVQFYITLIISPKDDSFIVEIAWSKISVYPENPTYFSTEIYSNNYARFRLSQLTEVKSDYWWYLSKKKTIDDDFFTFQETSLEESMNNISTALDDVFRQLNKFAIPYFEVVKGLLQTKQI